MNTDGVNEAFELIITELESVARNLNSDGAQAFAESRYADAESFSESGKTLGEFRRKLVALRTEWNESIDVQKRRRVLPVSDSVSSRLQTGTETPKTKKRPPSRLKVTMPDGHVIQTDAANLTMARAIEKIGLKRVAVLELSVSGVPLVSLDKDPRYSQVAIGNRFVCTHANNLEKKRILDRVATELGIDMKTEVLNL